MSVEFYGSHSCIFDAIKVYEGEPGKEALRLNLCGITERRDFLSWSNKVYVYFKTDDTFTDKGFIAVYNTTMDARKCFKVVLISRSDI